MAYCVNTVTTSGPGAGGMLRGDGQSLSGWAKRKGLVLFVVPVISGIDQPASLAVPAGGSAIAVTRNQERKEKEVLNKKVGRLLAYTDEKGIAMKAKVGLSANLIFSEFAANPLIDRSDGYRPLLYAQGRVAVEKDIRNRIRNLSEEAIDNGHLKIRIWVIRKAPGLVELPADRDRGKMGVVVYANVGMFITEG